MKIDIPPFVKEIIDKFQKEGFEIYIVGGAVRDILMGKIVHDWDFTTDATPEDMLTIFPEAYYDNKFGTVGLSHESSEKPYEITTFRTEHGYSDSRRPDKVEWGKSLEEDLQRRDFTINAMALRLAPLVQGHDHNGFNFEIIDPFAGQKDLKNKTICAVGDANDRFSEDALRMMRAVRIAAELNFKIEDKTFNAIRANAALINRIAKERVRDELVKILASDHPYQGMVTFRESGLMEEVLPELEKAFGVEQKSPQRHHIYDVGTHLLMALKECKSQDPVVRLAVLLHDIGKPQTYKKLPTGVITFYNHEVVGTAIAARILERLRFSKKDADRVVRLIRFHQFTVDEHQTDTAVRRFITNVGKENIDDMLELRRSDRLGSGANETSWRLEDFKNRIVEVQKQPFAVADLKISGHDVMKELNLKPGPKVGQILTELFEKVVNKEIENKKAILLAELKRYSAT